MSNLAARLKALLSFGWLWFHSNDYDAVNEQTIDLDNKKSSLAQSIERCRYGRTLSSGTKLSYDTSGLEGPDFWWSSTANVLRELVSNAGYSHERQEVALKFYHDFVINYLGPRPGKDGSPAIWRSFMTDDFSPIELSWNWGCLEKRENPKIRFAIEAIGEQAGSKSDPRNMKATFELLRKLERNLPNLDTSIFHQLEGKFVSQLNETGISISGSSNSSMFLAFELEETEPIVKIYFLFPCLAAIHGKPRGQRIHDILMPFSKEQQWGSLKNVLERLSNYNNGEMKAEPFMIAFDCVSQQKSRMKIYIRSADTSFEGVKAMITHFNENCDSTSSLDKLEELWHTIFGSDDSSTQLRHKDHETAGMLYYLEVKPGSSTTIKVYLPVKHYGINDRQAAHGLVSFLERRRGEDPVFENFLRALNNICTHRRLEDGLGLQTYISCCVKDSSIEITSYLSPEIYCKDRMTGIV